MVNLISSKQNFDIRSILDFYSNISDTSKQINGFVRYEKMQTPISLSIYRAQQESGSYLMVDRNGAKSTTWDSDTLAQLNSAVPLKKRYHSHNYFELLYVLNGDINEWIEDQCILLHTGDCILLDKNIRHVEEYFQKNSTSSCVFISIDDECVKLLASSELPYEAPQNILQFLLIHMENEETTLKSFYHFRPAKTFISSVSPIEDEMNAILYELTERHPGFILMIQGHLKRLFGILEDSLQYELVSAFSMQGRREELLAQITLLMKSSMGLMNKEELARRMNYNAAYLCRIIKESLGKSFTQYRLFIRLKAAETLLLDSNLTITEICEKLQFTNRTYFYKAFEQVFGVTPNKFRLQQQKI